MAKDNLILKTCDVELLGLGISMASRAIANFFNKHLKKDNITMNQLYILYAVAEYRGNNLRFISRKMFMNYKSMMVAMKSVGQYVQMHRSRHDKRCVYPALTEEGANFLKKVMPKIIDLEEGIGLLAKNKPDFIEFVYRFSGEITKKAEKFK